MAKFVTEMDDAMAADVTEAFCAVYGFTGVAEDAPAFAQAKIVEHMQRVVKGYQMEKAKETAAAVAEEAVTRAFEAAPITVKAG